MDLIVLTRQELFDLVWSIPIRTLAERYGITDVALAKRCKRHDIPKPGVGYWARVAAGQKPKRPTLPRSPAPHLERIIFKRAAPLKLTVPRDEAPTIEVAAKLLEPHAATLWARQRLEEAVKDHYGRLQVGSGYRPDLCVRSESVERALLLIDAIVKALVERGHEVLVEPDRPKAQPTIILLVSGERLGLQLEERLVKLPHVVTPAEEKEATREWGRQPQRWDYVPVGLLSIRLGHMHHLFRGRAYWTETKARPLEQQLGRVVVGIERAARAQSALREEEARREAEALAQKRKRLRGERMQWYRDWMAQRLEESASEWARARGLRQFLAAYESALRPTGEALQWLEAARHYADTL